MVAPYEHEIRQALIPSMDMPSPSSLSVDSRWTSPAVLRVIVQLYVLPVVVGWLLSVMLLSWLIVVFGVSIWTVSILAGLIAAVGTILTEEVVYDVQ